MDFRVFVYGGIGFDERLVIGHWPSLPMPVLEDYSGLRGGRPWLGFCILDDRPCLLWRELQNVEYRGGYPISVLLDPGDSVFERVNWNTARVLAILFESNGKPGRALLENPDAQTAAAVRNCLASLTDSDEPESAVSSVALEFWAAAAVTDDVLSAGPRQLGWHERPGAAAIANFQAHLPRLLKNSGGWLVGGQASHARQLNLRAVIDDRMDLSDGASADFSKGRMIIELVHRADHLPDRGRLLAGSILETPVWRTAADVELALRAVEALDRDLESLQPVLLFLSTLPLGVARDEWTRNVCEILLGVARAISPEETLFLMEQCESGLIELNQEDYSRLDPGQVGRFFSDRQMPPNPIPRSFAVPAIKRVEMWTAFIKSGPADAIRRLGLALRDLRDCEAGDYDALVDSSWQSARQSRLDLQKWAELSNLEAVATKLVVEVRRRATEDSDFNVEEYTRFGNDPDWQKLREILGGRKAIAFIRRLIEKRDSIALEKVALWPERAELQVQERRTAASIARGAWENFQTLDRLLEGRTFPQVPQITSAEKELLIDDLSALLSLSLKPPTAPNLQTIVAWLGPFDRKISELLLSTEPRFEGEENADAWFGGWEALHPDKHDYEFERLSLARIAAGGRLPPSRFKSRYRLIAFLRRFLFEDGGDREMSAGLASIVRDWGTPEIFGVLKQLSEGATPAQQKKIHARVHATKMSQETLANLALRDKIAEHDEIEIRDLLLGEGGNVLPERIKERLSYVNRTKLNVAIGKWQEQQQSDLLIRVGMAYTRSTETLGQFMEMLDEPQYSSMIEFLLDHHLLPESIFPMKSLERYLAAIEDLGPLAHGVARVRLSQRQGVPPRKRNMLNRLLRRG